MSEQFETTIELGGKTATGLRVPDEVVVALNSGKKPRVQVTVAGHTYRSTVAVYAGSYMLPLSAANRAAAGVEAGDTVTVILELDTAERTVEVPPPLEQALAAAPGAKAAFTSLSYTKQRELADSVTSAKRDETRDRRIRSIIDDLLPR